MKRPVHLIILIPIVLAAGAFLLPQQAQGRTALEKHVDFFDRNDDGLITVGETTEGMQALGFGFRSFPLAVAINGGLGRLMGSPWYDPLTLKIADIELGKHSSDTDIYDHNGSFDAGKFDRLFRYYDTNRDGALSESEVERFHQRNAEDAFGVAASRAEFGLLMELAGETRVIGRTWWGGRRTTRVLTRSTLQAFYDGTLFYQLAGEPIPFPH